MPIYEYKCKNGNDGEYQTLLTVSKKDIARKRPVKTGLLEKLLAWIARGATQSSISSTSCPT